LHGLSRERGLPTRPTTIFTGVMIAHMPPRGESEGLRHRVSALRPCDRVPSQARERIEGAPPAAIRDV